MRCASAAQVLGKAGAWSDWPGRLLCRIGIWARGHPECYGWTRCKPPPTLKWGRRVGGKVMEGINAARNVPPFSPIGLHGRFPLPRQAYARSLNTEKVQNAPHDEVLVAQGEEDEEEEHVPTPPEPAQPAPPPPAPVPAQVAKRLEQVCPPTGRCGAVTCWRVCLCARVSTRRLLAGGDPAHRVGVQPTQSLSHWLPPPGGDWFSAPTPSQKILSLFRPFSPHLWPVSPWIPECRPPPPGRVVTDWSSKTGVQPVFWKSGHDPAGERGGNRIVRSSWPAVGKHAQVVGWQQPVPAF